MNLAELQADLRHFAAERDWQPFHAPKNLTTALMVEAAELAEIFQWMTPEASRLAHQDAGLKARIGEEVADVLLYLLQVADHSEIDIPQAVSAKLASNALKYPAKHTTARASPARAAAPGTHVLLDYENVQPTEDELRALVPDAGQVWVFHGPQQRRVAERFASFGAQVTAVPISKTGKNALDFHLSFYMGYIAARNQAAAMVVVANDKGYEPMLEHARSMGFSVRQVGHGQAQAIASPAPAPSPASAAIPGAKRAPVKKAPARTVPAKKAPATKAAVQQPGVKAAPAKKAAAKAAPAKKATTKAAGDASPADSTAPTPATASAKKGVAKPAAAPKVRKAAVAAPAVAAKKSPAVAGQGAKALALSPDSAATIKKLTDSLQKMGDKRPTKPASLRRTLKSFLGVGATDKSVEAALARLIQEGSVTMDSATGASYPKFDVPDGSAARRR